MNKLYNTQKDFAIEFNKFISNVNPDLRKTQLNILPHIIYGMSVAESSVASDFARSLKEEFSFVQYDSIVKRIRRFYNNKLFDANDFYDKLIKHVISTYKKKHDDKRVHVIVDHMFSHDNYTTLMMSMRIGKQGKKDSKAFTEELILKGIDYIINLFKETDYKIVFLADRWFNSTNLMKHIDSAGHIYCFRLKRTLRYLYMIKKRGLKFEILPNILWLMNIDLFFMMMSNYLIINLNAK